MVADRDVIFDRPDGRLRGHHRRRRGATYAAGFAESLSRPETRAWHKQAAGHVRLHERDLSFRARWHVKLSRNPPGVAACFSRLAAWHVPGGATGSKLFEKDIHPRISQVKFDFIFAFGIGIYDGFLGPGTGTFLALAFMLGLGFNLSKATANTKALNWASNVASLILFLLAQKVWFAAGLIMGAGQWLGARAGSHMVITRGTKFIRPVFLTMVVLITLKMIYDNYLKT